MGGPTYPFYLCLAHEEPCIPLLCRCLDLEKIFRSLAAPNLLVKVTAPDQIVRQCAIDILVNDICSFGPIVARHVAVLFVNANKFPNIAPPIFAGEGRNEVLEELKDLPTRLRVSKLSVLTNKKVT